MQLNYKKHCGCTEDAIRQTAGTLQPYLAQLRSVAAAGSYEEPESSINLPGDALLLRTVLRLCNALVDRGLKYILVVGIGGSNLGTKAVYDSVHGTFDALEPKRFPKMIFVDTCDPENLLHLVSFLQKEIRRPGEILVNVISKSGGTTESVFNAEAVVGALAKKFPKIGSRFVVTTDARSRLWEVAVKKKYAALAIPKQVGGRYSVLSAVGLFPLAAAGLNVRALRAGALAMRELCLADGLENPAAISAAILYLQYRQGKVINDTFVFHPELESLGRWYRQLMGESIGKEKDVDGMTVHAGITPSVSVGSTDLHSVGQLYLSGPTISTTTFLASEKSARVAIPRTQAFPGLVEGIAGKPAAAVMHAILEGVQIAYAKRGLSFVEVMLPEISERALGEFLQFKMIEIMLLGQLLHVNAFDQPNVEFYKVETKRILGG